MMPNYVRRKYRMRKYARAKDLPIPRGFKPAIMGWGKPAETLLKRIQRHAGLRRSGKWNQDVQDLLFPPSFGRMVVRLAQREVGHMEQPAGSNDGPRVRVYQSSTGAYKAPWCASFVTWVYEEAAKRTGKRIKWFTNTAWVPNWTNAAGGSTFKAIPFLLAKPGDYVCLWGSQHIEIVVKRDGDTLVCIGGNTAPKGQQNNGGVVALTRRHKSEVTTIGRPR